jgi:hypothetical protein
LLRSTTCRLYNVTRGYETEAMASFPMPATALVLYRRHCLHFYRFDVKWLLGVAPCRSSPAQ